MEEERAQQLNMLAETISPLAIIPNHLSYCPTMDLLALAAEDKRVHVFRLNGQRVFGVAKKEPFSTVTHVCWKPNGQSLAVAFGSSVCMASAHTGKIMYEKDHTPSSRAPICCLAWASNFTDIAAVRRRMANLPGNVAMDDSLASIDETTNPQYVPDLPIELAFLDVAGLLPKLSTLPVAGSQGDIFSSRLSVDTLFKPLPTGSADRADVLVIGHEDGIIHLIPFDLRLFSVAGRELSLLASKITELHNLHRYLGQVQKQISTEGHKRWDKAVNVGYENVRRLTHESMLPVLDRLSVLISRLRGLSKYQSSDFSLGLSTLELDNMLDSIRCLQMVAHQLLKCAVSELQQFGAFSMWLRHEIEKQAAEPHSTSAQEIAEKDLGFDYSSILDYIQGAMTNSRMLTYIGNMTDDGRGWSLDIEGGLLFERYKNVMIDVSSGLQFQWPLPGLDGLIDHLLKQSSLVFERISETQRRNIQAGVPISLGAGNPACADLRMVMEVE
ncbi:MAG: hypothetical protein Q9182_001445 [Xanthomendoza sp. 2 TL-2023]